MSAPAPSHELHVVLVEPEIPWNAGNVGRTCLATGARLHLVRPLGFRLDERHVRRAGLDYWQDVHPEIWPSWGAFEDTLPDLGEPYFLSAEGDLDLWSLDAPRRTVLLLGSESRGFPGGLRRRYADRLVSIPMRPAVRSLNLSTTAAIAIYEVLRQWTQSNRNEYRSPTSGTPRRR